MTIATLTSLPTGPLNEAEAWEWGALADIGLAGRVTAVNELGWAVGVETDAKGKTLDTFLWQGGEAIRLPRLVTADGVTDSGDVAGTVTDDAAAMPEAALYQNGQVTLLGFLDGSLPQTFSSVAGVNEHDDVTGDSLAAAGVTHAYLWKNGAMTDLGVLSQGDSAHAHALDKSDQVVGAEISPDQQQSRAVLWQNGMVAALPQSGTDDYSVAYGINDAGLIVGAGRAATAPQSATEALLWDNGQVIALNSLLPANSGWFLSTAERIDNQGDIFGHGTYDGQSVSYELALGNGGTPRIGLSAQMAVSVAASATAPVTVIDGSEDVQNALDALQALAVASKLAGVAFLCLTFPTLSVTTAQMSADADALAKFLGDFLVTSPGGSLAGFSGDASHYSVTVAGDGVEVGGKGADIVVSGPAELRFADHTELVAAAPGSGGAVTSGNLAELYSAVFGREPDLGGLTFYQDYLQKNPGAPLLQFAEWFLSSPEYTANHSYALSAAGDAQFITDSYQNLLHRSPSLTEVDFYLAYVIDKASNSFQGRAQTLAYISASAEFLADVEITAQTPAGAQHWLVLT